MKPREVLEFAKKNKVEIVDLKFIDLPGLWQHFSISLSEFTEELFREGIGFDGSSIRGFQTIDESDMLLFPDSESAFLDPFTELPTLSLTCNVRDPITGQSYTRDARFVAQKAENHLKRTRIADISYWGPELEFYILDNVRFAQSYNYGFYYVDSVEGFWNSGDEGKPNLGYKPRYKEGYYPVPPMDHQQDIRSKMLRTLEKIGVKMEVHVKIGVLQVGVAQNGASQARALQVGGLQIGVPQVAFLALAGRHQFIDVLLLEGLDRVG